MKKAKPRHPESTLKGRLNLMTEDRDFFQKENMKLKDNISLLETQLRAKEDRFINYKRDVREQLGWYRDHVCALVSKIPGGAR